MKSKGEIERKIKSLVEEIEQLTTDRQNEIDKFGGISAGCNQDYFYDINYKMAELNALRWVVAE